MNKNIQRDDWINGIRQNQPWAFDAMYNLYVRQVYYMVKGMVIDRQVAEDITSEAFIKTFSETQRYADAHGAKSFLFTVARNAALDVLKINKRHDGHHEQLRYLSQQSLEDDAERKFIASEVINAVYAEIEQLPDLMRQIIKMTIFEEKTITEIADTLGISYKTVQNNKTKGIKVLRNNLLKNKLLSPILALFIGCLESGSA